MKAMFVSFVAIAVISVGAYYVLENLGFSAADTTAGPSVRLGLD